MLSLQQKYQPLRQYFKSHRQFFAWVSFICLAIFIVLQLRATEIGADRAGEILTEFESRSPATSITEEKTRQEVIATKIQNVRQTLFWVSLLGNLSAAIGVIAGLSGAWIAFDQYLGLRRSERIDRAITELHAIWEGFGSDNCMKRASSVAALQHYLSNDLKDYHGQIASRLAFAARSACTITPEDEADIFLQTLTPVVEHAFRSLDRAVLRDVSWRKIRLYQPNFSNLDLSGIDLRDAQLAMADFHNTDLRGAQLHAADLSEANFDGANLDDAVLQYADIGGASFRNARLNRADLRNVKVLHADLAGAELNQCKFLPRALDWRLIKNWRSAQFETGLFHKLIEKHGPEVSGPSVLMLTWEAYPFVSGGGWTAVYHLARNLRRKGTNLTLMVPWPTRAVSPLSFGHEIDVIGACPSQPDPDDKLVFSQYSSQYALSSQYSAYLAYSDAAAGAYSSYSNIVDEAAAFTRYATETILDSHKQYEVIHAHDWLTFAAAESLAAKLGAGWIAHFHSTELDRRGGYASRTIQAIEARACKNASVIVTPSNVLKETVIKCYDVPAKKIVVVPNCLSEGADACYHYGQFGSRRVIFSGRLTSQKGPESFAYIAGQIRAQGTYASFAVYGVGEARNRLERAFRDNGLGGDVEFLGFVDWVDRASMFKGASAVVVPSDSEPFGMIILEAMQYGVPVFFAQNAGASDVLQSGTKIDPNSSETSAAAVRSVLNDEMLWNNTVEKQQEEIAAYSGRGYEDKIAELYQQIAPRSDTPGNTKTARSSGIRGSRRGLGQSAANR